jgi:hypothetical protein
MTAFKHIQTSAGGRYIKFVHREIRRKVELLFNEFGAEKICHIRGKSRKIVHTREPNHLFGRKNDSSGRGIPSSRLEFQCPDASGDKDPALMKSKVDHQIGEDGIGFVLPVYRAGCGQKTSPQMRCEIVRP